MHCFFTMYRSVSSWEYSFYVGMISYPHLFFGETLVRRVIQTMQKIAQEFKSWEAVSLLLLDTFSELPISIGNTKSPIFVLGESDVFIDCHIPFVSGEVAADSRDNPRVLLSQAEVQLHWQSIFQLLGFQVNCSGMSSQGRCCCNRHLRLNNT